MDFHNQLSLLFAGADFFLSPHLIPYAIILINCFVFKLLRSLTNKLVAYYDQTTTTTTTTSEEYYARGEFKRQRFIKLIKLFIDELISTCELCADCAELNVVYEKHGSLAYGVSLLLLTCLWMETFGEAHTTPGYLAEEYFLITGNGLLKRADTYARFVGQSLAMPLAWRFASFYWRYHLMEEHASMLITENCRTSLTTSTLNGFLIELVCCLICRLIELLGHKLLERQSLSQRVVSLSSSFIQSLLVVMALELSGGYFNPVLAASLEYGCKGIIFYQHAIVFWIGPLVGHVLARIVFRRFFVELTTGQKEDEMDANKVKTQRVNLVKRQRSLKRKKSTSLETSNLQRPPPNTRSTTHRKKMD